MGIGNSPFAAFRHSTRIMDCRFEVVTPGPNVSLQRNAACRVIEKWQHLHRLFNRFDPNSEISVINRATPGQAVSVDEDVAACLQIAERLRVDTGGAFDIEASAVEDSERPKRKAVRDRSWGLEKSKKRYRIRLSNPGFCVGSYLDFGGIAKGYALDRGLEILQQCEVESSLLIGGTSTVLALGSPSADVPGWLVSMAEGWGCPELFTKVWLKDRALSASGTRKRGPHIKDPKKGGPAQGHLAAWASYTSAAEADALSTAFMVMETDEVEALCDRDIRVSALVITHTGACRTFNSEFLF